MRIIAAIFMAIALSCGAVFAQQDGAGQDGGMNQNGGMKGDKEKAKMMKMSGTVQSVDEAGMKITIKDRSGATKDVMVASDASIMSGNKTIKLSDVKPGEQVTISYTGTPEQPQAEKIKVSPMKGKGTQGTQGTQGTTK